MKEVFHTPPFPSCLFIFLLLLPLLLLLFSSQKTCLYSARIKRPFLRWRSGWMSRESLFFHSASSHTLLLIYEQTTPWEERRGTVPHLSFLPYIPHLVQDKDCPWTGRWDCLGFGERDNQPCWSCLSYRVHSVSLSMCGHRKLLSLHHSLKKKLQSLGTVGECFDKRSWNKEEDKPFGSSEGSDRHISLHWSQHTWSLITVLR